MTEQGPRKPAPDSLLLFMCGDVMTGRGIDQILPHPGDPVLYEPYVRDARRYVALAEEANGPIPHPVAFDYIWGDAIAEIERMNPDLRLINLETSVTTSDDYWKGKGIAYRMHPKNIPCITAAKIDFCALSNNHTLDWGYSGLTQTIDTLKGTHLSHAGAGHSLKEALKPAIFNMDSTTRVIVFSVGSETSGIPKSWAASKERPGTALLRNLSDSTVRDLGLEIRRVKQPGDMVIVSIHWGGNWGYDIPPAQRDFAHDLIDTAGVDVVYGHSSHHVKGMEVYQDKLILYGCGDFLNDYEGTGGYEMFRGDLSLMYFASLERTTGNLLSLHMIPTEIRQFRVHRASETDAGWLKQRLNQVCRDLGTQVGQQEGNMLGLVWDLPES
ncbi:MAG: CapA family protein [Deltaproteobacteria bacterium]|nr:CapA family protein [Deltaproteobacteria bacterium]